jgi:hypothetical protein
MVRKLSKTASWCCAAALVTVASAQAAFADWRFCYAAESAQHRFYMSLPFQVSERQSMSEIEDAFRQEVIAIRASPEGVGCPRAENAVGIEQRMRHAREFNLGNGNSVVPLDWIPAYGASSVSRR